MDANERAKFRQTKKWKDFRKDLISKQKIDPLTLSKLTKQCNIHHYCLDSEQYDNIDDKRCVALNMKTHDTLHFIYNIYKKDKDVIKRLTKLLKTMEKYNKQETNI